VEVLYTTAPKPAEAEARALAHPKLKEVEERNRAEYPARATLAA